jgi:type VI secretion system protein ImpD
MFQTARQPRLQITYVTSNDEERELPFVVGVMGDFSGDSTRPLPPVHERKFVQVERDNFDAVMQRMSPGLRIRVDNILLGDDSEIPVQLRFNAIADFGPGRIVTGIEPLRRLLEARGKLRDIVNAIDRVDVGRPVKADPLDGNGATGGAHRKAADDDVSKIEKNAGEEDDADARRPARDDGRVGIRDVAAAYALQLFKRLANPLDAFLIETNLWRALEMWFGLDSPILSTDARCALANSIDQDIAELDDLLAAQVDKILHHPRFQRLEASWRGLHYLVEQADREDVVVFKVIHWPWKQLCRDLERSLEFDQSELFAKVYSEEFGMPGGEPFGVLIGDYTVQHRPTPDHPTSDVDALRAIAQVAAAAFVPFVVGCEPFLLGLEDFSQLNVRVDFESLFRQADYTRWRTLQEMEEARFVAVSLPRVLMRTPYADDGFRNDGFRYQEQVESAVSNCYLWGNAAYAFGAVLVREFVNHGWFADIRGVRQMSANDQPDYNGGLVWNLPVQSFATDREGIAIKFPVEVSLPEHVERKLAGLGFLPIIDCRNTPWSAFRSAQSIQRPLKYLSDIATTNARLSAMLQYVFCVSRFGHYIKVIMRDRIGGFASAQECENYLSSWLVNYYTTSIDASPSEMARYPLQEAEVRVRELPGRPGSYSCTMHLRPHFQPTDVISSFRLVTDLAPPITTSG